ncbi:hypothetical protein FOA52_009978 [Chlamydomonas sp. UWO 241]|nr:hypothetical protein FOA52_009978 [Chlamydomonas sp. UWO 241]
MGALRERIVDCGVLPDLMTDLAEAWGTTTSAWSAEDLPDLSKFALMHAVKAWESDVQHIVTPSAVAAVLTISEGLWRLELQGRTHVLCPRVEEALLATLRSQLIFRVSWGMWGGQQLQNVDGERGLAQATEMSAAVGMQHLPEYIRTLRDKCWVLEAKLAMAEAAKEGSKEGSSSVGPTDSKDDSKAASNAASKKASKNDSKSRAKPPTPNAAPDAAPDAATKDAGDDQVKLVMSAGAALRLEKHSILVQLQQYEDVGRGGAAALLLVAEACAAVMAPQEGHTRGLAALPLLRELESTGVLELMSRAVAEALAEAQEASVGGDGSDASAVVDAADAAHRFVWSLLEDTGRSNTSNAVLANFMEHGHSKEEHQAAVDAAVNAVTRKGTTLALLCSRLAVRVMSLQPDLDVPPKEHPSLLLPSLLVRVAHEMTLVCSSIVTSVAQPESLSQQQQQQGQQQQQQQLEAPSRRLLTVASDDDESSETFASPLGSIPGVSGSDDWASVGTGAGTSSSRGAKRQQQRQQQQQLARPAADGAPVDLVDALECAHKECNDLPSAVAHVLDAARSALLQVAREAAEAHPGGCSAASTDELPHVLVQRVLRGLAGLPGLQGQHDD